tara:strand:+ start:448 stop:645 length:198 start_codon:yes stop_codon:yes gene_type:complete
MPVTNRFYKSFSQIGIGDKVLYLGVEYQVMVRLDKTKQVVLINPTIYELVTQNWEQLEIIDLMNE